MDERLPSMDNMKDEYIIASDYEAERVLDDAFQVLSLDDDNERAVEMLDLAKFTAESLSFVDNQTYPRPSHPSLYLRRSPYYTFASIITSLRCTLEVEKKITANLIDVAGDDQALLNLEQGKIEEIIRPGGFSERKAKWIVDGLGVLAGDGESSLSRMQLDSTEQARKKMMAFSGFGPKATDCFLLTGLNMPTFPVDVNVFKLVTKLYPDVVSSASPDFGSAKQVAQVKSFLEDAFPKDVKLYQVLHTYLLLANKHKVEYEG